MYVYVTEDGRIKLKSTTRIRISKLQGCTEHIVECLSSDRLIYEDNKVKKYENSRQYTEDINRYEILKENKLLKQKNQELVQIANKVVRKDLELEQRGLEANEYQRKIYQLRNMRGSQHS